MLESILITSDSSPMSQMFSYVFDIINSVYDIAIASGIQIIIFLSALQTFRKYVRGGQKSRDVLLGKVSGRLHFQW